MEQIEKRRSSKVNRLAGLFEKEEKKEKRKVERKRMLASCCVGVGESFNSKKSVFLCGRMEKQRPRPPRDTIRLVRVS